MDHVNNAVYADWLDEAVLAAGGAELVRAIPRLARLEYVRAAEPDVPLDDRGLARCRRLVVSRRRGGRDGRCRPRRSRRPAPRPTRTPRRGVTAGHHLATTQTHGGTMSETIDPVGTPDAYRASLLAELGDDDPAVVQAETPLDRRERSSPMPGICSGSVPSRANGPCSSASATSPTASWSWRPESAGSWPRTCPTSSATTRRCGSIGSTTTPMTLTSCSRCSRRSARANLDLWSRRSERDRARVGRHRERGDESYELTFRLAAGHDRVHLAQARRALEAVRRAGLTPAASGR